MYTINPLKRCTKKDRACLVDSCSSFLTGVSASVLATPTPHQSTLNSAARVVLLKCKSAEDTSLCQMHARSGQMLMLRHPLILSPILTVLQPASLLFFTHTTPVLTFVPAVLSIWNALPPAYHFLRSLLNRHLSREPFPEHPL